MGKEQSKPLPAPVWKELALFTSASFLLIRGHHCLSLWFNYLNGDTSWEEYSDLIRIVCQYNGIHLLEWLLRKGFSYSGRALLHYHSNIKSYAIITFSTVLGLGTLGALFPVTQYKSPVGQSLDFAAIHILLSIRYHEITMTRLVAWTAIDSILDILAYRLKQSRIVNFKSDRNVYIVHNFNQSSTDGFAHWYTVVEGIGVFQIFTDGDDIVSQPRIMQPKCKPSTYYLPFIRHGCVGKTSLSSEELTRVYNEVVQEMRRESYNKVTNSCQEFAVIFARRITTEKMAFYSDYKTCFFGACFIGVSLALRYCWFRYMM